MSGMVEKVARAIEAAYQVRVEEKLQVKFNPAPEHWGTDTEYHDMARAAIAAMREPTKGMVNKGESAAWDSDNSMPAFSAMIVGYQAMIDAALKESEAE